MRTQYRPCHKFEINLKNLLSHFINDFIPQLPSKYCRNGTKKKTLFFSVQAFVDRSGISNSIVDAMSIEKLTTDKYSHENETKSNATTNF